MNICRVCHKSYVVTKWEEDFYQKINISSATLCPSCRAQRRMAFRNEKNLYRRNCDACKKSIISIYSQDKPFPVYCQNCYWSDAWDATAFGRDFDFNKSFFEQYKELMNVTPRLAIINKQSENSDYCNYSFANKNCYLTFGNHYEEDCMYGRYSTENKDCIDYIQLYKCELCYQCLYSKRCYESMFLDHSEDCKNCYFSIDLKSCSDCLFSSNLRHKQYYIYNVPYSKEEYFTKLKEYNFHSNKVLKKAMDFFLNEYRKNFPFRATYQTNCEDCTGNNLTNCKNTHDSFDCSGCEEIAHGSQCDQAFTSLDMTCMGYDRSELCFETIGCSGLNKAISCDSCWDDNDMYYCNGCFTSNNCFGSISLQRKKYCILNKEYSKEEYETLLPKIIEHMRAPASPEEGSKNGEWGEFFPMHISPFSYNETVAQEFYPLQKEEVENIQCTWKEDEEQNLSGVTQHIPATNLPDTIEETPDDIVNWAIQCEESGKIFRIQKKELEFYKKLNIAIPHTHPEIRSKYLQQLMSKRILWDRNCKKCGIATKSSYPSTSPEQVYCEKCYLEAVY